MAGPSWRTAASRAARALVASGVLSLGMIADQAAARPFQVEDILQRAGFGAVQIAPGDRWLLVEQRGPIAAGGRFDFGSLNRLFRTTLMVADLKAGDRLRPLFAPVPGVGYRAGPISPDGARVAVYRLTATRFELGIATFATGEVRWLGLVPDAPSVTRTLQWRSPGELLAITLPPDSLPYDVRAVRPQAASAERWAAVARGEAVVTVVGSGAYIGARPQAVPKRLSRISAFTGEATTLATGAFEDLELSASGRRLALVEAGEDIRLAAGRPVQAAYGVAVRRMRLRLLDLHTGEVARPCEACDLLTSLLSWSPEHDDLLAYVRSDDTPWPSGRLIRVAAATGAVATVSGGLVAAISNRPERVYAGWWGADPILFGHRDGETRNDWFRLTEDAPVRLTGDLVRAPTAGVMAAPRALLVAADGGAWRIDRRGRAQRLGDQAFALPPRRSEGVPDRTTYALRQGEALAGLRGATDLREAGSMTADGRWSPRVTAAPGDALLALGPSGAVIDRVAGGGQETLLWRDREGHDRILAVINTALRDVDHPVPALVAHRGPNGERLRSWMFLPPDGGGAPPPLIVLPYPGSIHADPPARLWDAGVMAAAPMLLGHGYAVLIPSLPSPGDGRGPAEGLADQVLAIVDAAAAQPDLAGRFDAIRLGLWGHSFGGFATTAIVGQTERFGVAVATAPVTDLISHHGQFGPFRRAFPDEGLTTPWSAGWMESLQGDMRAPPWEDPQRYLRNSPLMQAGRIRTPLLIAVGEIDGSHPGQAEEMFSALFRQDRDALLLTYWGEPHVFGSPGNVRDLYRRGLDFLDSHLGWGPSSR
jgi:dipeptidyl aminopeptidase/acylaminoacyl peptidase